MTVFLMFVECHFIGQLYIKSKGPAFAGLHHLKLPFHTASRAAVSQGEVRSDQPVLIGQLLNSEPVLDVFIRSNFLVLLLLFILVLALALVFLIVFILVVTLEAGIVTCVFVGLITWPLAILGSVAVQWH
jgi:hypothetical protein